MEFKKFMAYSCMMALIMSTFTGCSDKKSSETLTTSSQTVQVTEIDGDKVTGAIGELAERDGQPKDQNGEDQQKPDGTPPSDGNQTDQSGDDQKEEGQQKPDGTPPSDGNQTDQSGDGQKEEGQQRPDGTPPADGEKPDGNGGPGGAFTASDDTITFTITDDTKIEMEQGQNTKAAAESDIKENSILEITLDENNQATKIVIKGGMGRQDKEDDSQENGEGNTEGES